MDHCICGCSEFMNKNKIWTSIHCFKRDISSITIIIYFLCIQFFVAGQLLTNCLHLKMVQEESTETRVATTHSHHDMSTRPQAGLSICISNCIPSTENSKWLPMQFKFKMATKATTTTAFCII